MIFNQGFPEASDGGAAAHVSCPASRNQRRGAWATERERGTLIIQHITSVKSALDFSAERWDTIRLLYPIDSLLGGTTLVRGG